MKANIIVALSLSLVLVTIFFIACSVNESTKTEMLTTTVTSTIYQTTTYTEIITNTKTELATSTKTDTSTTLPAATRAATPAIYELAPDFCLEDLDGNVVTLSQYRGSPVMLTFWKSRWPHVRKEFPYLQEIYQTKPEDLVFLTVNYRDSLTDTVVFLDDNSYTVPALLDPDSSISQEYGVFGTPTTFYIDGNGIIMKWRFGEYESFSEIERDLGLIVP